MCDNDGVCCDVVLLGDSGSLQRLVRKNFVNSSEFFDTKEIRLIRCVNGIVSEIPLIGVNLIRKYSNGSVLLCVIDHLPDGADFFNL